jgi:Family of unknown function (DUF6252)
MKKFDLLFLVVLFIAGCSKENNPDLPELTATFNDTTWTAFTIDTHLQYDVPVGRLFLIKAVSRNNQELYIQLGNVIAGKYSFPYNAYATYQPALSFYQRPLYRAKKGQINLIVDSLNNQISGTFNLILKNSDDRLLDSIVVTNGTFSNLKYSDITY